MFLGANYLDLVWTKNEVAKGYLRDTQAPRLAKELPLLKNSHGSMFILENIVCYPHEIPLNARDNHVTPKLKEVRLSLPAVCARSTVFPAEFDV